MKIILLASFLALPTIAHSQYKCIGTDGKSTFQQFPCAQGTRQQDISNIVSKSRAIPNAASQASSVDPSGVERIKKANSFMERDRLIFEKQHQIASLERTVAERNTQMAQEIDQLRQRKSLARNNLAGATWEQSLSSEMQAVTQKYQAINQIDLEQIRVIRAEVSALQSQK
jgi:hypothetical protein